MTEHKGGFYQLKPDAQKEPAQKEPPLLSLNCERN